MIRRFPVSVAAIVVGAVISGCAAGAGPGTGADGGSPPAQTEAPPQPGGVLQTIGLRDLPHLHPWTNPRNNISFFLTTSVYETLLTYEYKPFQDYREEYKIAPLLAERWDLRDNTAYTFNLKRNVKWHDGQPFTAQDVKFSYEQLADPAGRLVGGASLATMASLSVVDDYTVRITTKEPDVEFLGKLTESPTGIMPKHAHERGENFEKVAIGTGPFKVESNVAGRGTVYVPNREYHRPGLPYLEKWKMLPATDEAGRIAAFIAGQSDVVKVPNRIQAETVMAQTRNSRNAPFYRDNTSELFLKIDRPPFNDLRVRQALHLAVDRQAMADTLTQGEGLFNPPAINPVRKSWAIPEEELKSLPGWRSPKDQDIARAKQLLAEAGHTAGLTFTIRVDRSHPDRPAQSEMVSEQLRQMGVTAKLQPMESAALQKAWVDGDYEAIMYTGNSPDNWFQQLYSAAPLNRMPVMDPELDRLIEAQAREFDPAKRALLIREMQRLMIRQMYVIPTITLVGHALWQPYVRGWVDNQAANVGSMDWGQVWMDQATAPKGRS